MLEHRLALYVGEQRPAHPASAFAVFMDSAPDRWGRVLMERREAMAPAARRASPDDCRRSISCSAYMT
jgi:serine/threonine-protein kinase HipA